MSDVRIHQWANTAVGGLILASVVEHRLAALGGLVLTVLAVTRALTTASSEEVNANVH